MFIPVDVDETVALREAGMSGNDIDKGPAAETDEFGAEVHGFLHRVDMAGKIVDPVVIFEDPLFRPDFLVAETAFRDQQRQPVAFPKQTGGELQADVVDLPAPESGIEVLVLDDLINARFFQTLENLEPSSRMPIW